MNNKYEGEGVYQWDDGEKYSGDWKGGERNGKGTFTHADGTVEICIFENGSPKGEGISWSPDRKTAWKLVDGEFSQYSMLMYVTNANKLHIYLLYRRKENGNAARRRQRVCHGEIQCRCS